MILNLILKLIFNIFVPKIEKVLGEQSLLKNGTWAFLGSGNSDEEEKDICSGLHLNTKGEKAMGVGKKIPILIQRGDGKYYVSLTAERKKEM